MPPPRRGICWTNRCAARPTPPWPCDQGGASMIELQGVEYGWPDSRTTLSDISLTLAPGEKAVLLGANGSGKSTLLKLLNGLVTPTAGCYRYEGQFIDRSSMADRQWLRRFRQEVVLLFQHPEAMLFNPTVRDEIAY